LGKAQLLLAFLLVFAPSNAQLTIGPDDIPTRISLHPYSQIADAGHKIFGISEVISGNAPISYKPVPYENADLGFTTHHFWVRTAIANTTSQPLDYFLEVARPVTDIVDLYSVDAKGNTTVSRNGDAMRFKDRGYHHRKCIFKIHLSPNTTSRYFIHLKSDGEAISLALHLRDHENLTELTALEQFTFGIFYGILAIAAIIYFFFYFALRERTFLFYSFYILFVALMQFALDGYFFQYIAGDGGYFALRGVLIFASLSTIFLGRYSQLFLKIKKHDPGINGIFNYLYYLIGILFAALLFVPRALPYCYPLANIFGMLMLALIIASVIRMDMRRIKVDMFFKIGILFLVCGFVVFILNNFGQIPTSFFSQNASKFGTGLEVIFLSLSMANLIGILRSEKEEFNRLALEKSEEMNEMKSYFLSNISHELRTPLNAILNLSNDIIKNAALDTIRQNAQVIKYSSHSLLSSVNDILDFSKIEKGELKLESVNFEPVRVLEHIKNNAVNQATDQGLEFRFSKAPNIPEMLSGDVTRLSQIVRNVISNALKFTSKGFVAFYIDWEQKPKNRARLLLTVSDSGVGISKEKLGNIYGAFTQQDIDNKRKFGGLGLGLFIVRTLVDLHEGSIKIQSKPGEGTTCKIALDYDIVAIEKPAEAMGDSYDLGGKRVLVVEDNAINQMVVKMLTKKWLGTETVFAAHGEEGLELLKESRFDIVLMDLQMPVMDGYEATAAIRAGEAGEENRNIPIIAVTADVMETTKQAAKDIGMNDYLSKPLKNDTLFEAIRKLVSEPVDAVPRF
jgi:signal transduction histidine kinase/ActR/RegA family two-component response regulator